MESVYVRYSNALLSLALQENKVSDYKEAIKELLDFLMSNEETFTYLKSYFVDETQKYEVVDKLVNPFKLQSLGSFIKLLIKKHIFNGFKYIANEFIKSANEEIGILEGIAFSVTPLTKSQITSIEEAISKKMNSKVELINKIDTRLIGGVKVSIHDRVFDGSILNKLETLKENIKERRNA